MKATPFLVIVSMFSFLSVCASGEEKTGKLSAPTFVEVTDVRGYRALVLVPSNTDESVNGKLPAILFLHGIGESGNDLNLLKQRGFPRVLEGDQTFPFIFIMPQCPSSTEWYYTNADNVSAMRNFLDDVVSRYPVDPSRLYITGLSMGGIGAWYFAINLPSRFAALVPVAFRGDGWSPAPAKDIPVWAFHGALDGVIPLSKAQELVDQFRAVGGTVRFDPYPAGGHDGSTWTVTYSNPDLYDWLLRKKKLTHGAPDDESGLTLPVTAVLAQNFPNPFNPMTAISYQLPTLSARQTAGGLGANGSALSTVSLKVFDLLGREVAVLVNEKKPAGLYTVTWDASAFPGGVYFYRLVAGDFAETKKLVLVK